MIHLGDLFDVLPTLDAESIDACVTDPPYGIGFMGREWDTFKPGEEAKRIVPNKQIESDNPNLKGRTRGPASSPSAVGYDESVKGHEAFMGWTIRWATEVYRVLKPGAHLLVCGAPRSYHWMACGLEYAGFEIRDSCLYWGFGQGFPKSLNVSNDSRFCQCAKERGEQGSSSMSQLRRRVDADEPLSGGAQQDVLASMRERAPEQTEKEAWPVPAGCGVRVVREDVSSTSMSLGAGPSTDMLAAVQRQDQGADADTFQRQHEGAQAVGRQVWTGEPGMEGRCDVLPQARELQTYQVRAVSGRVDGNGSEGRLCDGAPSRDGELDRATTPSLGGCASRRSRSAEQSADESSTLADEQQSQVARRWPLCDRCGKSVVPSGLGTALKPAYEPIVVGRKPFRGSVAQNVERHGTAALNIDACRVPTDDKLGGGAEKAETVCDTNHEGWDRPWKHDDIARAAHAERVRANVITAEALGRWPANVLLDEFAASELDRQTGELGLSSGGGMNRDGRNNVVYVKHQGHPLIENVGHGDTGGASRFYYVAKPSREERDFGTAHLTAQKRDESRKDGNPGGDNPRNRGLQPRGNFHPTVKPVELMRWLVRLVTPPGGTVLDPFCGSGTTGMACRYELRSFIGIEREPEYFKIAEARIAAVAPLFGEETA